MVGEPEGVAMDGNLPRGKRHSNDVDDHDRFRQAALKDPDADAARKDAYIRANLIRALAQMRTKLGMTQRDVALAMRTTQSAVSDLENGLTDPRLSTLQRYARAVQSEIGIDLAQTHP